MSIYSDKVTSPKNARWHRLELFLGYFRIYADVYEPLNAMFLLLYDVYQRCCVIHQICM
jgi:hypothetical protein